MTGFPGLNWVERVCTRARRPGGCHLLDDVESCCKHRPVNRIRSVLRPIRSLRSNPRELRWDFLDLCRDGRAEFFGEPCVPAQNETLGFPNPTTGSGDGSSRYVCQPSGWVESQSPPPGVGACKATVLACGLPEGPESCAFEVRGGSSFVVTPPVLDGPTPRK